MNSNTDVLQSILPAPPFAVCSLQDWWLFWVSICDGNKLPIRYIEIYQSFMLWELFIGVAVLGDCYPVGVR